MRKTLVVAFLLLCSACDRGRSAAPIAAANAGAPPDAVAAADPDSGQARAETAGLAVLGQPAPAVVLHTVDGKRVDLAKFYGRKPVYLKFWATWCVPCREQMPAFEKDYEELGGKVQVVAVNTGFNDTPESVKAFRTAYGLKMPVVIDDGTLASALNLRVTPQHVVVGRDGHILYVGHLEDAKLHQALAQAMQEEGAIANGAAVARASVFKVGDTPQGLEAAPLAAFEGAASDPRPRLLVFFSPWCESYLVKSQPTAAEACRRVREAVDKAEQANQVRAIGISSGLWATDKDLQDYRRSPGTAAPLMLDANGQVFRAFDVHAVPTIVVLNASGRIVRRLGPNDAGLSALAAQGPSTDDNAPGRSGNLAPRQGAPDRRNRLDEIARIK